jgi:hypothetical protein
MTAPLSPHGAMVGIEGGEWVRCGAGRGVGDVSESDARRYRCQETPGEGGGRGVLRCRLGRLHRRAVRTPRSITQTEDTIR